MLVSGASGGDVEAGDVDVEFVLAVVDRGRLVSEERACAEDGRLAMIVFVDADLFCGRENEAIDAVAELAREFVEGVAGWRRCCHGVCRGFLVVLEL